VTRLVRLAKAKVAGSNPVFRSKLPGSRLVTEVRAFSFSSPRKATVARSQRFQRRRRKCLFVFDCGRAFGSQARAPSRFLGTKMEHESPITT